ncbi:MAG: hypothetical protein J6D52_10810, partial [Clostridia bacterium]|nr:hypothetical protein [Clostridia bacterium]
PVRFWVVPPRRVVKKDALRESPVTIRFLDFFRMKISFKIKRCISNNKTKSLDLNYRVVILADYFILKLIYFIVWQVD